MITAPCTVKCDEVHSHTHICVHVLYKKLFKELFKYFLAPAVQDNRKKSPSQFPLLLLVCTFICLSLCFPPGMDSSARPRLPRLHSFISPSSKHEPSARVCPSFRAGQSQCRSRECVVSSTSSYSTSSHVLLTGKVQFWCIRLKVKDNFPSLWLLASQTPAG